MSTGTIPELPERLPDFPSLGRVTAACYTAPIARKELGLTILAAMAPVGCVSQDTLVIVPATMAVFRHPWIGHAY